MQLLDRAIPDSIADVTVMNAVDRPISGQNQKTYTRLKTSLRLNLRRQIFLAVCDDLDLRNRLVSQLQAELAPRFISLNLNLADPNPMAQVSQWLSQRGQGAVEPFGFQILGIEHLTRQPAPVQTRFLTHLQAIEYYMPTLECTMLLWLPRPWLRHVQQSASTFWDWHTALFQFEGDPTPARLQTVQPCVRRSITRAHLAKVEPWTGDLKAESELEDTALQQNGGASETIWNILTQDLALFDQVEHETEARHEARGTRQEAEEDAETRGHRDAEARRRGETETSNFLSPPLPLTPSPPLSSSLPHSLTPSLPHSLTLSPLAQLILAALAQEPDSEQHRFGWNTLERIEQLQQQQVPHNALAAAHYALGRSYRESIEQGDSSEHTLTIALALHRQTIDLLEPNSDLWADVSNDLGNLYWLRSRSATEAEVQLASLEQAIAAYEAATNSHASAKTCAMIQNNLGSAYGDLAQYQQPAANLQKSVQAYETALQYRTPDADPARYAATQNNLGTACWNLAQHQQPVLRLQQAIVAYSEALRYYTPDNEPMSYAMIQNNIGTAYWNLAQHAQSAKSQSSDRKETSSLELLRLAIAAYEKALVYRTLEAAPTSYAATQNNLGTAHWDVANLSSTTAAERREHLQLAISSYEAAIATVSALTVQSGQRPALTFDVFATRNNLGLAHYQLATDSQGKLSSSTRQKHLETALQNHLEALEGWDAVSNLHQSTLDFIVQTVRALFNQFGIAGQNLALSQIPANLLPDIMTKL